MKIMFSLLIIVLHFSHLFVEDYPWKSPECSIVDTEYSATDFLRMVHNSLMSRITKLPKLYSLSHLLNAWEMAIRQACSPNSKNTEICNLSILLGM